MENSISELRQMVERLVTGSSAAGVPATSSQGDKTPFARVIELFVGTIVSVLIFQYADFHSVDSVLTQGIYFLFMIGASAPFAFYLAIKGSYKRVSAYLGIGLTQIFLKFLIDHYQIDRSNYRYAFAAFAVTDSLLFLSVGLFKAYSRRTKGTFSRSDVTAKVAYNLIGRPRTVLAGSSMEDRWKRVSQITGALAPIITLIGSIVAAYFGYLAAVVKAGH